MATEFARGVAAQVWGDPIAGSKVFDIILAEAFANVLDKYLEALQWTGGSDDFQINGKARIGWEKIVAPLISKDWLSERDKERLMIEQKSW